MMERPTCSTCVHFNEAPFAPANGKCWKEPPSPVIAHDEDRTPIVLPWIPPVESDYGCSHHPSFPAYVASLNPRPPEVNLPLGERVKAALLNLDEGAGDEIMARTLTPRELEIMRLAFGFGEGRVSYSLDEIARIFKVTRARSRQIYDKAVRKLSLLREVRDASLIPLDSPA